MQKKLENLRSELVLRLSVITKKSVDRMAATQSESFSRLDQRTATIVQRLLDTPAEFITSLNNQTAEIYRRHDQSDLLAVQLQQETLSAISRLQSVSPGPYLVAKTPSPGPQRNILTIEETREKFIEILKFRHMYSRQDDVAIAYPSTFRWIVRSDSRLKNEGLFDPLLPWLLRGQGAYWVNGKAGSGKSTLMKFLGSSREVRHAIESWAHSHRLIMASFYFWRSGTLLQRSQEGLLRWLLYTILSQQPELVQTCFPNDFEKVKDGLSFASEIAPNLELMKEAFSNLSQADLGAFKIFLFIDGVDEFDGDHAEITEFFRHLASSASFKIILSSRPIPACVEAFKTFPGLRLQDLTQADIRAYVEGNIGRHERMDMLLSENRNEASKLVNMILNKASGVFLWVRLVVKSLLDGFQNYDRISDLKQRIDEFPPELGALYLHMFRSMQPRYQSHAAQLLRIVLQSIEVQESDLLTVIQLSFADEENPSRALSAPVEPMNKSELKARSEAMAGRIRSRCCGLIEVHGQVVQVIHKSVLEFLTEGEVWENLLLKTRGFDPNQVLIAACLLTIKTRSSKESVSFDVVRHCLRYCHFRERSTHQAQTLVVSELMRILPLDDHPKLLRHACMAGMSQSVDFLLRHGSRETLTQLDIPSVVVMLVETIAMNYTGTYRSNRTFSLTDQHTHILKALIAHMAQNPYKYVSGQLYAWVGVIRQIKNMSVGSDWVDSQGNIDTLRTLVAVIDAFLQQDADVTVSSLFWSPSGDQSALLTSTQNPDFSVTDILLPWLEEISSGLMHHSEEDVALAKKITEFQNSIVARQSQKSQKYAEWSAWLSHALPAQTSEAYTKPQPRIVLEVPGGPFEMGATSPSRLVPSASLPLRLVSSASLPLRSSLPLLSQGSGNIQSVHQPSLALRLALEASLYPKKHVNTHRGHYNCSGQHMPWRQWIEWHYYGTCLKEQERPQPTIKIIHGLFELPTLSPKHAKLPMLPRVLMPKRNLLIKDTPRVAEQKKSRHKLWKSIWK